MMLWIITGYFIVGMLFGVYFALTGYARIDSKAASVSVLVRLMWLPAAVVLWPVLLQRLVQAKSQAEEVVK